MNTPKPFSPQTLAERWDCSSETVRTMCHSGAIGWFPVGKLIRIPAAEVERFECQTTDSSSTEDVSASPTPTPNEDAFAARLVRQTVGLPKLALVNAFESQTPPGTPVLKSPGKPTHQIAERCKKER